MTQLDLTLTFENERKSPFSLSLIDFSRPKFLVECEVKSLFQPYTELTDEEMEADQCNADLVFMALMESTPFAHSLLFEFKDKEQETTPDSFIFKKEVYVDELHSIDFIYCYFKKIFLKNYNYDLSKSTFHKIMIDEKQTLGFLLSKDKDFVYNYITSI